MRDNSCMYINNPNMAKVRRLAVNDVIYRGLSYSQAGRKYGVTKSAICKWLKKADPDHRVFIETVSCRPHHHPNEVNPQVVARVIELRKQLNRCAPVLHAYLKKEGIKISQATVGRILKRQGLIRKAKRPTFVGRNPHRPVSNFPGDLVQIDTMHVSKADYSRFYIYALIDTFSRFAYAEYRPRMTHDSSVVVVKHALTYCAFPFRMVQSDNGPEFRQGFSFKLNRQNIAVRHSRVRRPNDNAHVERFIRTIQEEAFKDKQPKETTANRILKDYLHYYNHDRLHLGINLKTPAQIVSKVMS